MADMQGDAERFFAQIEGMSGAQLAERGRIARMQQRWTETPWYRREHGLEQLAIATAEIFGLLHDSSARVEAVRDAAQDMVRDADADEPLTEQRKRSFMDEAIKQLAEANIAPTAYFANEPAPDAQDDAPADTSARWSVFATAFCVCSCCLWSHAQWQFTCTVCEIPPSPHTDIIPTQWV